MYFSARHYSALIRVYYETFGHPVPEAVQKTVASNGNAPVLLQGLRESLEAKAPIRDWTPFVSQPRVFSAEAEIPSQ